MEIKGTEVKLKKDYLTNAEVNYILSEVLNTYIKSGDIKDYDFSPLSMITAFYSLLFSICIEDYEISNIDDYNKYYNIGAQYELLKNITNAEEAYHLMMLLSERLSDFNGILNKGINNLMDFLSSKIPDAKEMNKMVNKLPKEWQKVMNDYNNITNKNNINEEK